ASSEALFPGATLLSSSSLSKIAGGAAGILASERTALQALREAYADRNRFAADAGPVSVREKGARLIVEVPVREGPAARVAGVTVEGSTLAGSEAEAALRLAAGAAYDEAAVAAAGQRLRDHYLGLGYPRVRVSPVPTVRAPDVELAYRVVEGP